MNTSFEKLLDTPLCEQTVKKKNIHKRKTVYTEQTKALQTLQGFLLGIIADDILTESEVFALKDWLDTNNNLAGQYPFDRVFAVISKALEDGVLEQDELDEMLSLFKKFTSPTDECACAKDIGTFEQKTICLTGDFEHGARKEIEQYPTDYPWPSCLVIGCTPENKILHVVIGSNGEAAKLITAYWPDSKKWNADFTLRKE